ncbi:hypothetical protein LAJ19_04965 [Deinococcus taeanensis]|uniref:hypothetical protein n=1 Tax=Deinococcus taeanensis TaxID=2737050 RepID=UPI001CDCE013|nr:hypothetical protein [Deinococcus taeanensis]UBV43568.1 hypothetical protein LAJ19_04965 [Deinococcus taeanensis]
MDSPQDRTAAWAALGLARPRALPLSPGARARLAHMAELRDITGPADAARAGAEFAGERWLAPDLLGVRSWLPPATPGRQVVTEVLRGEWSGFLALLGEYGPWVYVPDVRALQNLTGAYGALVAAASRAGEAEVLQAARLALEGHPNRTLLVRLEATSYRQPDRGGAAAPELHALESGFWAQAAQVAHDSHARWQARRL